MIPDHSLLISSRCSLMSPCNLWKTIFSGRLTTVGGFSTSSLYSFLNYSGVNCKFAPTIWNLGIPYKFKCFPWLAWQKKLNTMEILGAKLGKSLGPCMNCGQAPETVEHLFSTCSVFLVHLEESLHCFDESPPSATHIRLPLH